MQNTHTERRLHARRPLNMPVAFFLGNQKKNISNYHFGSTKDVCVQGVSVSTASYPVPDVNMPLTLIITPKKESNIPNTGVSIQIKGKVIWNNRENKSFGIRFT